jgi:hypothetical protein
MTSLSNTESALIEELLDCIGEALERTEGVSREYANKTKLQKLLYFAIKEYDLPVTYSWYLAGAVVPDTSIGPSSLPAPHAPSAPSVSRFVDESAAEDVAGSFDDVMNSITDDFDSSVETQESTRSDSEDESQADDDAPPVDPIMFTGSSSSPGTGDDGISSVFEVVPRSTLVDFYTNVVPEVWSQNTMRFLQNFYQETAPPEYRSLYIESTHLRTHLQEVIDTVDARCAGDEPSQSVKELELQLGRTISDVHYYLRGIDELRETLPLVTRGTDLLEDAVAVLRTLDPSEYTEAHVSALEQLKNFFYYQVWRYPCLRISATTATGPSADELASEHRAAYDRFPEQFENAYRESVAAVRRAGLFPEPLAQLEPTDDSIARKLTELSGEYLN